MPAVPDYRNDISMQLVVTSNHIKPLQRSMHINAELAAARSARVIARDAAANAPVLTGALRDSIRAEPAGYADWYVAVGAPYGEYIEFGTMYMNAQPYLLPAAMRRFPEFVEDMRDSIMIIPGGANAVFG